MSDAAGWDQLIDLITSYPGTVTAASNAYFMVQRSPGDEFDLISNWHRAGSGRVQLSPATLLADCEACTARGSADPSAIVTCQREGIDELEEGVNRYCMSLATSETQKAVLAFDLPNDRALYGHQARILADTGPEMALALENANLLHRELKQAEATRTERQRIARYLHDTLGQNVSFLRLKLDQLSTEDPLTEIAEIRHEIERMRDVADEAYDQVRNTLSDLRITDHIGLSEALQIHAEKVAARAAFDVEVSTTGTAEMLLPQTQRQVLYISREALNNVEKHAHANLVKLNVAWRENELNIRIVDDGVGFHRGESAGDHFGLIIMDERATAINGEVSVNSATGAGTKVHLRLPLPA
jgi:two-component system nitrate/nitrite sensor histidine kinase NarX